MDVVALAILSKPSLDFSAISNLSPAWFASLYDQHAHCTSAGRKRQPVFLNHLDIALGSQAEVEVQLEIAKRVGFISTDDYGRIQLLIEEVGRMLNGLISSMRPKFWSTSCRLRATGRHSL